MGTYLLSGDNKIVTENILDRLWRGIARTGKVLCCATIVTIHSHGQVLWTPKYGGKYEKKHEDNIKQFCG